MGLGAGSDDLTCFSLDPQVLFTKVCWKKHVRLIGVCVSWVILLSFLGRLIPGKTTGVMSTINGIQVYTATPSEPIPHKALLIFPDIFGVHLRNTQLIADRLALDLNVATYLIDTFSGHCAPEPGKCDDFDLAVWLKDHGPEKVLPIIETVIKHLTEKGNNRFAAVGYCFGESHTSSTTSSSR